MLLCDACHESTCQRTHLTAGMEMCERCGDSAECVECEMMSDRDEYELRKMQEDECKTS